MQRLIVVFDISDWPIVKPHIQAMDSFASYDQVTSLVMSYVSLETILTDERRQKKCNSPALEVTDAFAALEAFQGPHQLRIYSQRLIGNFTLCLSLSVSLSVPCFISVFLSE